MKLIDRSAGGFFALVNAGLFTVILGEILVLRSASVVALVGMLAVIVLVAALLVRWMMQLLGPEDRSLDYAPRRGAAKKPQPQPALRAPVATRRPVAR